MNEHDQLSQYTAQYVAAYEAHRKTYELRNPPPVATKPRRENALTIVALGLMVTASVIVSGSRTITEFGDGIIGIAAFAMIEAGIVSYAYIRTRSGYDQARHVNVAKLVNGGMWLAFVVAVAANVHATLKHNGVVLPEQLDVVILVILAISAPVLAFIAGDVLGMFAVMGAQRQRQADEAYKVALDLWRDGLNTSWNGQKARMGVSVRLSSLDAGQTPAVLPSVLSASERTPDGQTQRSGFGHTRTPDGQQKVIDWLNAHPKDAEMGARDLGKLIGVGHDTANKGRNAWKQAQTSVRDVQSTAMQTAMADAEPVAYTNGHTTEVT